MMKKIRGRKSHWTVPLSKYARSESFIIPVLHIVYLTCVASVGKQSNKKPSGKGLKLSVIECKYSASLVAKNTLTWNHGGQGLIAGV